MEAPARKSAITWVRSGGAVAVEIRWRCMRSLLHEIFNEGAGFGKAVRRREMSIVRRVGRCSFCPPEVYISVVQNYSEAKGMAGRNAGIARRKSFGTDAWSSLVVSF